MLAHLYTLTADVLLPALKAEGVRILGWDEVPASEQAALGAFFRTPCSPCSRHSRSTARARFRCCRR